MVEWLAWQPGLAWPGQRRYRMIRQAPPAIEPPMPPPAPPEPPPIVHAEPPGEESNPEPLYEPDSSPPPEATEPEPVAPPTSEPVTSEPVPPAEPEPISAPASEPVAPEAVPSTEPGPIAAEPAPAAEPEPAVEEPARPARQEPVGAGLVPPGNDREPEADAGPQPTGPRRSWLPQIKRRPPATEPEPQKPETVEEPRQRQLRALDAAPPPEGQVAAAPPAPEEETSVVRMSSRRAPEPQRWNLWDLESIARQEARSHPARRAEWSYLFVHLRQFADAEGTLPSEFDGLVREAFGEMLEARNLV
jgi:hypothetical protein